MAGVTTPRPFLVKENPLKIRLSFKTPDVMDEAIADAVNAALLDYNNVQILEETRDDLRTVAKKVCEKFIKYGECVTIEIDTETGEATVLTV